MYPIKLENRFFEKFKVFIVKILMKALFTDEEFNLAKSTDLLPCECYYCHKIYYQNKHEIQTSLNPNHHKKGNFCSKECQSQAQITQIKIKCTNCEKEILRAPSQIKKVKNHFCSQSCAAQYNNTHKTKGNRRSKLEQYLENRLNLLYPNLKILFNNKETINSELDIYMPSLKLAFELNGIFHYEPIYGQDKLNQIQNNDNRKFQACLEQGIELCVIDVSQEIYFKKQSSEKYLKIINNIVHSKGIEPSSS